MKNERISNHVMVSHGKQFNELCQPILKVSPINYIGLARIYEDGSRSYLITDPVWGKILLKNKYHLAGTEDALINGPQSSYHLWSVSSMFTLNQQTQNLFQDCIANNYGNGITLIERGRDFVEFIHICANSGYESVDPYLANNVDQLWKHVLYIREALSKDRSLKTAYEHKYQYNYKFVPNNLQVSLNQGYVKTEPRNYYLGGRFGNINFTPREMDCLILLYQNKSTKEQAKILNLSHRTIEHLLEKIKNKAICKNKAELILELTRNNAFNSIIRSHDFVKPSSELGGSIK